MTIRFGSSSLTLPGSSERVNLNISCAAARPERAMSRQSFSDSRHWLTCSTMCSLYLKRQFLFYIYIYIYIYTHTCMYTL